MEPPESMNVRLLFWLCVFSVELISRSEDSYWVCVSNSVCDLGTATIWRPRTDFGCFSTKKEIGKRCPYLNLYMSLWDSDNGMSHSSFTNRCTFIKTLITIYVKIRWLLHVSVYDHHQGARN